MPWAVQQASPPPQAPPSLGAPPGVDTAQLQQLTAMGFPHWRVVRALMATRSAGARPPPGSAGRWSGIRLAAGASQGASGMQQHAPAPLLAQ